MGSIKLWGEALSSHYMQGLAITWGLIFIPEIDYIKLLQGREQKLKNFNGSSLKLSYPYNKNGYYEKGSKREKRGEGAEIRELGEENVPEQKDITFQNERAHGEPTTMDEERPIPWYTIKKVQNTRDRIFSKLPVREKKKTKPTKQGLIEKDLIAPSLEQLQITDNTTKPSKF